MGERTALTRGRVGRRSRRDRGPAEAGARTGGPSLGLSVSRPARSAQPRSGRASGTPGTSRIAICDTSTVSRGLMLSPEHVLDGRRRGISWVCRRQPLRPPTNIRPTWKADPYADTTSARRSVLLCPGCHCGSVESAPSRQTRRSGNLVRQAARHGCEIVAHPPEAVKVSAVNRD